LILCEKTFSEICSSKALISPLFTYKLMSVFGDHPLYLVVSLFMLYTVQIRLYKRSKKKFLILPLVLHRKPFFDTFLGIESAVIFMNHLFRHNMSRAYDVYVEITFSEDLQSFNLFEKTLFRNIRKYYSAKLKYKLCNVVTR